MDSKIVNKILEKSYHMKWNLDTVPHGLIDIIRGCNCKCSACYNNSNIEIKPYEQIIAEIDAMLEKRNLTTIGIVGGEPLLHPDLFEIIKYIKQKNIRIELLSNGVLIDEKFAKKLAEYRVDIVLLHIDVGQVRCDLKNNFDKNEINKLRDEKAELLAKYGIDVGMSATVTKNDIPDILLENVNYFKNTPYINTLLLTLYKDIKSYDKIEGNIEQGLNGRFRQRENFNEPNISDIIEFFSDNKLPIPYWYITGCLNKNKPRWLMYLMGINYDKSKNLNNILNIKYSNFEKMYLKYYLKRYKKYPTFEKRNSLSNIIHILLNGIMGGFLFKNIGFLLSSINKEVYLKRILVQEVAEITPNGIEYCENCPDATIKNGQLVPNCISDHIG